MSICRFNHVFAILFGAAIIVSMTSVLAEISISNSLPDLTDSPFNTNCSISPGIKPDSRISDNRSIKADVLDLPLSFIENQGQLTEQARFMVQTGREMVLFAPSEVVFRLSRDNDTSTVRMTFENSYPGEIIGEGELSGRANFFIGNDSSQWISAIPTYEAIRYKNLYPGVDLVFKGTGGCLKHELIVAPDADPSKIVMAYSGQDNLSLTEDGSVLLMTSAGSLTDSVPVCYQEIDGMREMIEGSYHLIGENGVGFEIGSYDRKHPLVIDPALAFSTYLGGSGDDSGLSIAVDSAGNVYVAGYSASANFPTKNPIQPSNASSFDAFVAKINPSGQELIYSTYLGGGGDDYARGIAVDGSGNAYVTGYTASANFPTKNPLQASKGASDDAFVAKINPAGSALIYSTYLGGSGSDYGEDIAVDSSGNAYITGYTGPGSFPTKNPIQGSNAGLWDAFVSKINPAGSALVYSTYLGGSGFDYGQGIAVDSSGNAYITGSTYSTNFPTKNPLQASNKGGMDAFVSKINPAGSALVYSTYLGGSFNDYAEGIAVDRNGNSYIAGYTISDDFPTKNPIQSANAGSFNAFVSKINSAGSALSYSTYLGGNGDCFAHGIAVDGRGNAFVTGETSSTDFPIKDPVQSVNNGSADIFVTAINGAGSALIYSSYLGGMYYDYARGIALGDSGRTYLAGYTESPNFPAQDPLQAENGGNKDVFVAMIDSSDLMINHPPNTPSPPLGVESGYVGAAYFYTTSAFDPDGDQVKYTFDWGDGTTNTTDLAESGATAGMSHIWSRAGIYQIKARAIDSKGATSGWSAVKSIEIVEREEWILYYPDFTDTDYPDSWRSWLMLQNPADVPTAISLELRDRSGELRYAGNHIIPANAVSALRPRNLVGIDYAGSAIVKSERPISGSCQNNRNSNKMCMSYNAIDHGSNQLYYPDFTDTFNPDGWRSLFVLQNPSGFPANLNLEIRSRAGDLLYQGTATIPARGVITIRPRNLLGFDCAGSAVIVSDQLLAGTCQITRNNNEMCMSYNAIDHGSNQLYYPDFTDTFNPDGWRSLFVLQNPSGFPANLNIEIRSRAGDLLYQGTATIPAHGVITIRPRNLLGFDCAGSAAIVSDQLLAGTCQITRNSNKMCMSYNAIDHGSNQLYYPDFTDTFNPDGWRSLFVLQNPSGFPANLNIEIRSRAGDLLYQGTATIPAHGVNTIRPRNLIGFDSAGSASIISDRLIIGTCQINRNNNEMCMSYTASD